MDSSEGARRGIEELKLKNEEHVVAKYEPGQLPITCFSEIVNDATLHFQIIHFPKQVFASILILSTHFVIFYFIFLGSPNYCVDNDVNVVMVDTRVGWLQLFQIGARVCSSSHSTCKKLVSFQSL